MNMITYASPIALRPQRKYALGLYVQSLTYQNIKESGRAVLQVTLAFTRQAIAASFDQACLHDSELLDMVANI